MSLKRRLQNLECRPWKRPIAKPTGGQPWILPPDECEKMRSLQRKLCLPLPEAATPEERAAALRVLIAAQARTRIDRGDTGGVDDMRAFALGLHSKYGTDPYWGDEPFG